MPSVFVCLPPCSLRQWMRFLPRRDAHWVSTTRGTFQPSSLSDPLSTCAPRCAQPLEHPRRAGPFCAPLRAGPVCNHVCNQKRLLWDVWHSISSSLLFASGPLHVSQCVRNHRVLWYRVVATPSCHMCMSDVVRARPREAARGRGRPRVRAGSLSNYRSIFVSLGVQQTSKPRPMALEGLHCTQ